MIENHVGFDGRYCRHNASKSCDDSCFYRRMLSIVGKKYTLNILRILMHTESARFNKLAEEIRGSPKTLTDRLNELASLKIVKREPFAEIPPRVEYSLTERGRDLKPVMEAIRFWVEKWWISDKTPMRATVAT